MNHETNNDLHVIREGTTTIVGATIDYKKKYLDFIEFLVNVIDIEDGPTDLFISAGFHELLEAIEKKKLKKEMEFSTLFTHEEVVHVFTVMWKSDKRSVQNALIALNKSIPNVNSGLIWEHAKRGSIHWYDCYYVVPPSDWPQDIFEIIEWYKKVYVYILVNM